MKKILIALLLMLYSAPSRSEPVIEVDIETVTKKVSDQNFLILQNAMRVYQSKEAVNVSRGQVLPRLNVWKWSSMLFDIRSATSIVEDVAPFLVPSNWFRVQEQKELYESQRHAYYALWLNEVYNARVLYYKIFLDQRLSEFIKREIRELNSIKEIVASRELWGALRPGSTLELDVRILALEEDLRSLNSLLIETRSLLAMAMSLDPNIKLVLLPMKELKIDSLKFGLDYSFLSRIALERSPEVQQYENLISVARIIRQEFSVTALGLNTLARGFTGSQFDSMPIQPGLGFGTPASIRIARGQQNLLILQKWVIEEVIKKQIKNLILDVELDFSNLENITKRVEYTKGLLDITYKRISMGEEVDLLHLVEASRNHIAAEMSEQEVELRFYKHMERKNRLLIEDVYNQQPVEIESLGKFEEKLRLIKEETNHKDLEDEKLFKDLPKKKCRFFRKIFGLCKKNEDQNH
ncbi:MAG: TolC family protein [Xanthomonadaceae bacterium]|nr:TolC family protein [Xanthomonadaceae bacterium]